MTPARRSETVGVLVELRPRRGRDQEPPTGPEGEGDWRAAGNCVGVDPDLFFPKRGESTREAKAVCQGCTVRDECLEHALARPERYGIWGGASERERRRLRRARRLAAQQGEAS